MVKDTYQPYRQLKRMVRKYYLSFYCNYLQLTYKYYMLERPIDLENLINKELLREKLKEEVISEAYFPWLKTK